MMIKVLNVSVMINLLSFLQKTHHRAGLTCVYIDNNPSKRTIKKFKLNNR